MLRVLRKGKETASFVYSAYFNESFPSFMITYLELVYTAPDKY